jgi:GNAT superfamily N-acetyltransferase
LAADTTRLLIMNDISVRQAVLSDLDELAALFDAYRVFQGRPSDPAAAQAFLRARFDHGESIVFMAFSGGRALGFAQLYPSFSSVALQRVFVLNDLFVHADGRRRGVASALLAAVERHAWSLGAVRVTLNVARDNLAGQALYAAQGWSLDAQFHMLHRYPAAR